MGSAAPLAGKDSFVDLELQRRRLEDSIQQLRKSLQHWQLWEAEYEGLKEEIASLNEDQSFITVDQLERVGKEFGGNLLNQKEIDDLFKDSRRQARNASQIQGLLSRRIDYVQENVKALERRLTAAEEKLQSATVISQPYSTDEEGLPLTEIREELDDDGNVVSSTISKPGDSTPQVLEALQKAGVEISGQRNPGPREPSEPLRLSEPLVEPYAEPPSESELHGEPCSKPTPHAARELRIDNEASTSTGKDPKSPALPIACFSEPSELGPGDVTDKISKSRKKSVSFSEVVQIQTPLSESHTSHHGRRTSQDLRDEMLLEEQKAFKDSAQAEHITLGSPISSPIIPTDESLEEAVLRRQMLDYNMNEVGTIVAEINLDDSGSYDSERFDESDGTDTEDEDDEAEDEHGRTTRRVIDDDYRAQMLTLEKKLSARMMVNVGPQAEVNVQGHGPSTLQPRNGNASEEIVNEKKAVRFADNVDVSGPKDAAPATATKIVGPLLDVAEHSPSNNVETRSSKPKKPSKFKSSRPKRPDHVEAVPQQSSAADMDKPRPSFTPGETHAGTVLERAPPVQMNESLDNLSESTVPAAPDEFDDTTMGQELAMEYNRLRNRMIQRQGGFMQATDEEENERPEPSDLFGEPNLHDGKKASRFKAARLAGMK